MRRESGERERKREGGGRGRATGERGKEEKREKERGTAVHGERERHGVGVHMTSAMLERHSGISAAPTAGLRGASVELSLARPTVLCGAAPRRCTAPCGAMHSRGGRHRRPRFLFDLHGESGSSPPKRIERLAVRKPTSNGGPLSR